MTAKEQILDIQRGYLDTSEFVLDSLSGGIDKLERAFPGHGAFLMEFIQNADDAYSKNMIIEITNEEIRVFNDGAPFSSENVTSICKVGRSSKTVAPNTNYVKRKRRYFMKIMPELSPFYYFMRICTK